MSTIPVRVTQDEFEFHFEPYLSRAQRGFVSKIPLHKIFNYILYRLHTGCQWAQLPIASDPVSDKKEISWHAVYYHFRKWSRGRPLGRGSLERAWQASVVAVKDALDLSEVSLDGSHTAAKKGGVGVSYQGRKRAKTSNLLCLCEAKGSVIACRGMRPGHHHDAFEVKPALQTAFKSLKRLGLKISGALFHADPAFDTKAARKTCFNHALVPNIKENPRGRKVPKRGRKRFFDETAYKRRFVVLSLSVASPGATSSNNC